jgi:Short C-terminal domain
MFVRRRPLLRAAVVGGGAYMAGKSRARNQAEQQYAEDQQDARISDVEQNQNQYQGGQPPGSAQSSTPSIPDQLNQLNTLHDQGALTDAEFAAAKQRLLSS